MGSVPAVMNSRLAALFAEVARQAKASGAFAYVEQSSGPVACVDPVQPEAQFRIEADGAGLWVSWVCGNRYISQSIEADLMWTGDDLDELIEEELADQGYGGAPLGRVEHFRNEAKQFTFRSRVPLDAERVDAAAGGRTLLACLLAYQAAFRELGDMKPDEEEGG